MLELLRSSALRVALTFAFATIVATTAIFGLVYLQIRAADEKSNRLILEDEAAKSVDHSVEELRRAFELRLTHDLRRLDFAALFASDRKAMFGNIEELPAIPLDGKSHYRRLPRAGHRSHGTCDLRRPRAPRRHYSAAGTKPARNLCVSPDRAERHWRRGSPPCCCWRWRSAPSWRGARRGA